MKKRMEIKLKAVFEFDTKNEDLLNSLADTPLALALAFGLEKHLGAKVTAIEKADRTIVDLDRMVPDDGKLYPLRPVHKPRKKAGSWGIRKHVTL